MRPLPLRIALCFLSASRSALCALARPLTAFVSADLPFAAPWAPLWLSIFRLRTPTCLYERQGAFRAHFYVLYCITMRIECQGFATPCRDVFSPRSARAKESNARGCGMTIGSTAQHDIIRAQARAAHHTKPAPWVYSWGRAGDDSIGVGFYFSKAARTSSREGRASMAPRERVVSAPQTLAKAKTLFKFSRVQSLRGSLSSRESAPA